MNSTLTSSATKDKASQGKSLNEAREDYVKALEKLELALIPAFNATDEAPGPLSETRGWDDATEPQHSLARVLLPLEVSPADKARFKAFGEEFIGPLTQARDALALASNWARPTFYDETRTPEEKGKYFRFAESHHIKLSVALQNGGLLAGWQRAVANDAVATENDAKIETVKVCFEDFQKAMDSAGSTEQDRICRDLPPGDGESARSASTNSVATDRAATSSAEHVSLVGSSVMVESPFPSTEAATLSNAIPNARSRSPSTASTLTDGILDLDR